MSPAPVWVRGPSVTRHERGQSKGPTRDGTGRVLEGVKGRWGTKDEGRASVVVGGPWVVLPGERVVAETSHPCPTCPERAERSTRA